MGSRTDVTADHFCSCFLLYLAQDRPEPDHVPVAAHIGDDIPG